MLRRERGRRARRSALPALAAVGVVVAACGGGGGAAADSPQATVERYFAAVDRADGAEICSFFTEDLRGGIAELQSTSCERALTREAQNLPGSLNAYEIAGVRASGDRATVELQGAAFEDEVELQRVNGAWRIASAPGLGQ